jgi:hypothetical protein
MFARLIRQHRYLDKTVRRKETKYDESKSMPLLPGVHVPTSLPVLRRLPLSRIQLTRLAA